jgi:GT2 family glycosyltransferase
MTPLSSNLFLVIPTHNRCAITRECLGCLGRQTDRDFETIVVDDGSTDGTREMIRSEFPGVILLEGDGSLWWSESTNRGVRQALAQKARSVMTLNDDTLPPPEFIARMKQAAAARPSALIGAMAVSHETGRPLYWGERVRWPTASFRSLPRPADGHFQGLHEVTHFPGRGLLIPSSTFNAIGLFDAVRFPQYAADYDFTHRARRAGFRVLCNYDAPLLIREKESGGGLLMDHRSWRNYVRHLTGIKGVGNLRIFLHYAHHNCPWYWLPFCLFVGSARRLFGYPARWLLESLGLAGR